MSIRHSAWPQAGFTYLGLLFLLAAIGVGLAQVGIMWSTAEQREKERQLLFVGAQFRAAIRSYHELTPGAVKRYPASLDDLLEDRRLPVVRRHLRRIYVDPMTASTDWGLVMAPDGGIMGVFSKSERAPLKVANFRDAERAFEGKSRYSEWKFVYRGGSAAPPAQR